MLRHVERSVRQPFEPLKGAGVIGICGDAEARSHRDIDPRQRDVTNCGADSLCDLVETSLSGKSNAISSPPFLPAKSPECQAQKTDPGPFTSMTVGKVSF
jgi:hypothetical protein